MDVTSTVTVGGGATEYVPFFLTSTSDASYTSYPYSVSLETENWGIVTIPSLYVNIIPRCDQTVQAALTTVSATSFAGGVVNNSLLLTNPNPASCGAKTYVHSTSYPFGWSLSIPHSINVDSGTTVAVPFSLTVNSGAALGVYPYRFWVYNAWADGSGQAVVDGSVTVFDNAPPTVAITSPADGNTIPKNKIIGISVDASDNVGVVRVEFYLDGTLICTDTTSNYTCSFKSTVKKNVAYTIVAKAYDAAGNTSTSTSTVTTR